MMTKSFSISYILFFILTQVLSHLLNHLLYTMEAESKKLYTEEVEVYLDSFYLTSKKYSDLLS